LNPPFLLEQRAGKYHSASIPCSGAALATVVGVLIEDVGRGAYREAQSGLVRGRRATL